jgi:hypothetical protein
MLLDLYSQRTCHGILKDVNDSGFLASSILAAIIIIIAHYIHASTKNLSLLRIVLTGVFLLFGVLFASGESAALTFSAVSDECTRLNQLAIAADQFARISGTIVGLNLAARSRGRRWHVILTTWTVVRLSMSQMALLM